MVDATILQYEAEKMAKEGIEGKLMLLRFVGDYELFGDVDATTWMTAMFDDAKRRGDIQDFKILNSLTGHYGIQFVTFTIDVKLHVLVTTKTDELLKRAAALLNSIVMDDDVEVRWVGAV